MSTPARITLRLLALAWLLFLAALVAACGGGGDDSDPTAHINPPECQAHPETCR